MSKHHHNKLLMDDDPFSATNLFHAANVCMKSVAWKEHVSKWMGNIVENVCDLKDRLDDKSYQISDPNVFHIEDPKPRTITATRYVDRVVQKSMCLNGLYKILTKSLIYDNCSCQKNKGISFALDRLKHHMQSFYRQNKSNDGYVIRLDIRKYFASIPHVKLKEIVDKKLRDEPEILRHVHMIIDKFLLVKSEDDLSFLEEDLGPRGIVLGSQVSQLLALVYLSPLDHFIKEKLKVKHYVRYMDDMIILINSKEEAHNIKNEIEKYISNYGLKLNPKSSISKIDKDFKFLKVLFRLTKTGKIKHRLSRKCFNKQIRYMNLSSKMLKQKRIPFENFLETINIWNSYSHDKANNHQKFFMKKLVADNFKNFNRINLVENQ